MSLVQQVSLLAAGCQPWNKNLCAANGDRFAYCATLAVYIYKLDQRFNEFKLWRIISEHKKTILSVSWHPRQKHIIATSGADGQVIVWNMDDQVCIARLTNRKPAFSSIAWCYHDYDCLGLIAGRGPLYTWNALYNPSQEPQSFSKDSQMLGADVTQVRWHPRMIGKVVLGHKDGTVSIFMQGQRPQRHVFRPESLEESEESEDPVTDLHWDPLSTDYLLVANVNNGIRLLDTESDSVIMSFQLPSLTTEIGAMAWVDSAPGMFLTGDANSGVLRVWTVSKPIPLETIKLKQRGFQALYAFHSRQHEEAGDQGTGHVSSTSESRGPLNQSRSSLPRCHVVCTFADGGVGLYNLGKRKWEFLRDSGHIETIFDCKFKPDDYSLLATASFDGTIKIWDTESMTEVHTSPGHEGVIYCISWAPADLNCLAASTIRNGAFIWDVGKGRIIQRFTEHTSGAIYCVSWCEQDSKKIATCGADGWCVVQRVDGAIMAKFLHPCPVFGCDWNPHNKDMLATTCDDGVIRVYYLSNEAPIKTFSGHTSKAFQVKWSPLRDGVLCSGSDDGTVRVWDYSSGSCVHVLEGHKGPVRGLLWNPEVPYLLLSGSWDYSIRVWDIRDGACLDTILDHGADVYGLASHPQRPFVVASSSRDSTVRLWSLRSLLQPLAVHVLTDMPWSAVLATPEQACAVGALPMLTGSVSRSKKVTLDKLADANQKTTKIRWFSQFFSAPIGADNLWDLVLVAQKVSERLLSSKYSRGIMHMTHLAKFRAGEAQELEMQRAKHQRRPGSLKAEDCVQRAADIHISLGNVQRYCELMVELGRWEKALALAPGVSMNYWKALMERRVASLRQESSNDVLAYCMASGMYDTAVQHLVSQGQYQVASTVAQTVHDSELRPPLTSSHVNGVPETSSDTEESMKLVLETTRQSADWYLFGGQPVRAACCYLAVDRYQECISTLVRGNELELAVALCLVLNIQSEVKDSAVEFLARRCEKIKMSHLGVDVLKLLPSAKDSLLMMCARFSGSKPEIDDLYEKAGLPSMDDCVELLKEAESSGHVMKVIRYGLLANQPQVAMTTGLRELKGRLSQPDWTADDVYPLIQILSCFRNTDKMPDYGYDILLAASYVGALMAIRRRYDVIILPLFNNAKSLLQKEGTKLPITEALLDKEMIAWKECSVSPLQEGSKYSKIFTQLMRKCGDEPERHLAGGDCTTGSQLPSHSDVHVSILSGTRIQGPAYFLDDGKSAISVNEALMWAKVNPFSPLNTGARLNPF